MEKSRYSVLDSSGKATIVERKDGRYIDIEEMAQHVAFNVLDDYSKILNGEKKIDETNIILSINVLNAVAPLAKYFRTGCAYGKDTFAKVGSSSEISSLISSQYWSYLILKSLKEPLYPQILAIA